MLAYTCTERSNSTRSQDDGAINNILHGKVRYIREYVLTIRVASRRPAAPLKAKMHHTTSPGDSSTD